MKQRELRFRIWNGIEMVYDVMVGKFGAFFVNPANNGIDERDAACLTPFNTKYPEGTPIMQFTGLLDKEGKEIYEGDLIECAPSGTIGVVRWYDELCMFTLQVRLDIDDPEEYTMTAYSEQVDGRNTKRKVIGDVFTTPELIKTTPQ